MKAVPKVNTDGLYLEDTLVDDAFYGVVPFYAPLPELPPETDPEAADEPEEEVEEAEPEIAGYVVGVPVPQGLYLPQFDLAAWEAREEDVQTDPTGYWVEGLTPEEIEELTKPQPQEPNPVDLLGEELTAMKLQSIQQQSLIGSMGSELATTKLTTIEQQQTIASLGSELAAAKLEIIQMKGGMAQ
ncbi:hypothetical protein [Paenibacillus motobuensis]|uniref:Bacteriophage SP-beta YorD domain-containing protein n=1 Tax=Paenibacillus motobuensis TaxID=295324 RepID=A0ABN0Y461_9BACL